jgi:hypothetical protein
VIKTVSYIFFAIITICLLNACASQNMGLGSEIDAGILANDYARDIKAGNRKYKGEYLTVTGKIAQAYKNKYQQSIIILMDKKQVNGVKCFLNNASRQINKPLKQGALIRINGRCAGFDEFVLLKGCIILKN